MQAKHLVAGLAAALLAAAAEMAATMEADRKRYGEVIKRLNISLD